MTPQNNQPTLTPGAQYHVKHERFGSATVEVIAVDEVWANCEIIQGTLKGLGSGAVWRKGDTKMLRIEHAVWNLTKNP